MSEPKLISPMLDHFAMGDPISDHHGVRCCPAMENNTDDKYIVKIISVPASQTQLDAMLLSGAFADEAAALDYYKNLVDGIADEVHILDTLSAIDGFIPYKDHQIVPMDDGKGYDIYLLGSYKRTLTKQFKRHIMTHLDALNLGLDLCAALAVCRRSGYLYVDLKPSNIYLVGDRGYKIGDLGFVRLDSLKYASLPDRYLSEYTAPEVTDAYSALNTTIDVYAAGLVLYQLYNNAELPKSAPVVGEPFEPPLYADYEMSEIILKACAPRPEDRWQDPMQMGQAIISYMQRNGASDLPIVPAPAVEAAVESTEDTQPEEPAVDNVLTSAQADTENTAEPEALSIEDEVGEAVSPDEDFENLSFLDDELLDETDPVYEQEQIDYTEVTGEVSHILSQADELASVTVPEPVVVPDHVELPIPELPAEPEPEPEPACEGEDAPAVEEIQEADSDEAPQDETPAPVKNRRWLRNCIIVAVLLALIFGAVYYYQNYYLQPIDAIVLEGSEDSLIVQVSADIDESLLTVICSDTYGNQIPAPIVDGKAVFTGLVPDTAYRIHVVSNGFHRLTGNTATAYSTPIQTNIVQFHAVNGSTDGSVILSFTVDGPDSDEWSVTYSAEGEEPQTLTFPSHTITITGLTMGSAYTFTIEPKESLYLNGPDTLTFTPSKVVSAQNLSADSFMNNMLSVSWDAPEDAGVANWSVRCYNDNYNETIVTDATQVSFDEIDHSQSYQIEVTAQDMSVSQIVTVEKNTITAYDFSVDVTSSAVNLSWKTSQDIPADGWVLRYYAEGLEEEEIMLCDQNSATIAPLIPGATYHYRLEEVSGNTLLGSDGIITIPDAPAFACDYQGIAVSSEDLVFRMCRTPETSNWDRYDLRDDDFTTTFHTGENASFLVRLTKSYGVSEDDITTLFVIYSKDGTLLDVAHVTNPWVSMWYRNYCELNMPIMPSEPGDYIVNVYFNGAQAATQEFTVTG